MERCQATRKQTATRQPQNGGRKNRSLCFQLWLTEVARASGVAETESWIQAMEDNFPVIQTDTTFMSIVPAVPERSREETSIDLP